MCMYTNKYTDQGLCPLNDPDYVGQVFSDRPEESGCAFRQSSLGCICGPQLEKPSNLESFVT